MKNCKIILCALILLLYTGCAKETASIEVDTLAKNNSQSEQSIVSENAENSTPVDADTRENSNVPTKDIPISNTSTDNQDTEGNGSPTDSASPSEDNTAQASKPVIASYDLTEIATPFIYFYDHGNGLPMFVQLDAELADAVAEHLSHKAVELSVGDTGTIAQIVLDDMQGSIKLERTNSEDLVLRYKGKVYETDSVTAGDLLHTISAATGWDLSTNKLDINALTKIEMYSGDECVYSTDNKEICLAFEALMAKVIPADRSYYSGYTALIVCTKEDGNQIQIAVDKDSGGLYIAPLGFYSLELGLIDTAYVHGQDIAINASALPAALGLNAWPKAMYSKWIDAAQLRRDMITAVTVSERAADVSKLCAVPAESSYAAPVSSGPQSTTGYTHWALINPKICVYNDSEMQYYYVTVPIELTNRITQVMRTSSMVDTGSMEQLFYIELSGYERFFICQSTDGELWITQDGFGIACPDIIQPLIEHIASTAEWYQQ